MKENMRTPHRDRDGLNRGAWTPDEDRILVSHIEANGARRWSNVPSKTGLKRCGKSCRLRWVNYLRPDLKRGNITHEEEDLIIRLHKLLGNRWSLIAGRLPGRTDNEIKNYWNTTLKKRMQRGSMLQERPIGSSKSNSRRKEEPSIDTVGRDRNCGDGDVVMGNTEALIEDFGTGSGSDSLMSSLIPNEEMMEDWLREGGNQPCYSWEFDNLDLLWL